MARRKMKLSEQEGHKNAFYISARYVREDGEFIQSSFRRDELLHRITDPSVAFCLGRRSYDRDAGVDEPSEIAAIAIALGLVPKGIDEIYAIGTTLEYEREGDADDEDMGYYPFFWVEALIERAHTVVLYDPDSEFPAALVAEAFCCGEGSFDVRYAGAIDKKVATHYAACADVQPALRMCWEAELLASAVEGDGTRSVNIGSAKRPSMRSVSEIKRRVRAFSAGKLRYEHSIAPVFCTYGTDALLWRKDEIEESYPGTTSRTDALVAVNEFWKSSGALDKPLAKRETVNKRARSEGIDFMIDAYLAGATVEQVVAGFVGA